MPITKFKRSQYAAEFLPGVDPLTELMRSSDPFAMAGEEVRIKNGEEKGRKDEEMERKREGREGKGKLRTHRIEVLKSGCL